MEHLDPEQLREETLEAYRECAVALGAYTRRLTEDSGLAQDAVQETFLRFFLARMQGEVIRNRSAWLHRVAHNYICEIVRSSAVRASVALDEETMPEMYVEPRTDGMEWDDALQRLLAPRESQCLRLRTEGLDYTEIAERMAIRPGTVGALLHRAMQKLRVRFGGSGRTS